MIKICSLALVVDKLRAIFRKKDNRKAACELIFHQLQLPGMFCVGAPLFFLFTILVVLKNDPTQ